MTEQEQDTPVSGVIEPQTRLDRAFAVIPRLLSSKVNILFLLGLGVYLVVLPLLGVEVSAAAELIGGNFTNVTSDIGACIAAGGTAHLIRQNRRRHRVMVAELALLHAKVGDLHRQHYRSGA